MASKIQHVAHMVFFTLKRRDAAEAEALVAGCHKHLADHEGVVHFSAGLRATAFDREVNDKDFDVALHVVFESKYAHDAYQVSPRHQAFIAEFQGVWERVRVFDSLV